jgi:hypothetical protein
VKKIRPEWPWNPQKYKETTTKTIKINKLIYDSKQRFLVKDMSPLFDS